MRPKVLSGTAAALFVLTLAACSSGSTAAQTPEVASLAVKNTTTPAPSETSDRPRERLDTTPEEFEQLLQPYYACMDENGIDAENFKSRLPAETEAQNKKMEKYEEADAICNPAFWPLPPWEKDPANPEARDFAQAVVKCLKEKGIKYVDVDADGVSLSLGGADNHMPSITKGMELAPECEREVAAQK